MMRLKIKWRADGEEPLQPEAFELETAAKARARELLAKYGSGVTISVWNDAETWQIITPAGIAEWCNAG
jgi:hypothetical protein